MAAAHRVAPYTRPPMADDPHLHLADRLALRDLVEAYARHADRLDLAALAALFTEHGVLAIHPRDVNLPPTAVRRGRDEIESAVNGLRRYEVTTHLLGQQTLDLGEADPAGETSIDTARGETYCLAHHVHEVEGRRVNHVLSIRYLDEYERTVDGWRFAARRLVVDWTEYRPMDPDVSGPPPRPQPPEPPTA